MEKTELKPCPFCGGAAVLTCDAPYERRGLTEWEYKVECTVCHSSTRTFYGEDAGDMASDIWNLRIRSK